MTTASPAPGASAPGGLDRLRAAVDALRDEDVTASSAAALGEQLSGIEALIARLRHEQARRAVAFDAAGGPMADGFATAAAWLRANTLAAPRDAADLVAVGRALRDRLPATAAALADGGISFGSATAIARALRDVRDPDVVAAADATLADVAPTLYPSQVGSAARRVLEHLDPELLQRDAAQRWADRTLSLTPMLDGAVAVSGQLDEVSGAVLLSALTPMMTPLGPDDTRTAGQRRADALVELVGQAARMGAAGTMTGTGLPPTLLVKVDIERLRDLAAADAQTDDDGADDHAANDQAANNSAAHNSAANNSAANDTAATDRAHRKVARPGARGAPPAELDWGGPILDDTLRRIGCSAQLARIVTEGPGRVLNVGRARRLATPAQNVARMSRDDGCLFPGCDRPPEWTEAHHRIPWSRGGPTDLDDLLSFCAAHHHLLHEGGWSLRPLPAGLELRRPDGSRHSIISAVGASPATAVR